MTAVPIVSRTTNATTSITATKTSSTASYVSTSVPVTPKQPSKGSTGRKFDGLSFFGGMILGATICVVLLFSLKYYQAKKRSYHSL